MVSYIGNMGLPIVGIANLAINIEINALYLGLITLKSIFLNILQLLIQSQIIKEIELFLTNNSLISLFTFIYLLHLF